MRPADENQHSTRPNLMSSGRRAGSDQSILEMLDRDSGRGPRRKSRSRLAWYGAGGALAASLIGLLVWLTREGPPLQEAHPVVVADTPAAAERAARSDPADELAGITDLDDPPRPHHAALVDEPPGRQSKPATSTANLAAPPSATAAAHGAVVRDEPNTADNSPEVPGALPERGLAPAGAAPSSPDAAKAAPARTATDTAKGRTGIRLAQSGAHGAQRKAPRATRARKASGPAKPVQPVVDSDVALISAVIQHSGARPEGDCGDGGCAAKTTAQP